MISDLSIVAMKSNKANNLIRKLQRRLISTIYSLWDRRLARSLPVYENTHEIFRVLDFGSTTRMRASSFETKEPETIRWINIFREGEKLLDIGANIGIYSLYSALKGLYVISVEPEALTAHS